MRTETVDVLVIGAGPAGAIAAGILHKNGHSVKVIEKQQFPRFVIGESLIPRCLNNLEKAGLLDAVYAQGFQRKNGASFVRDEGEVCNFDFAEQFSESFPHAWQMPRAGFDKALTDELQRKGVEIAFQESVENVTFDSDKVTINVQNNNNENYLVEAQFVVDASGFGRVLPRLLDLNKPSVFPARTAFFAHFEESTREDGVELLTEIIDLGGAWAWVIPIKPGVTSVGFVGEESFYQKYGQDFDQEMFINLFKTHRNLSPRFDASSTFVFEPKVIRGFSVGVKQMYGDRFVLVGNSTEFLDPIFSSGVALATETGAVAGELLSRQLNGASVDWEKEYSEYIQEGLKVFRTYVKEWYTGNLQTIFFATEKDPSFKKQICSVLAGYVWDKNNPYVKKHQRAVPLLADVIRRQKQAMQGKISLK